MALLPHQVSAEIDIAKLRDYCLSASHPRGRHKARAFYSALGVTTQDAEWLRREILAALPQAEAERQQADQYGARWLVDIPLARQGRRAVVRTVWMIGLGSIAPRLVTCWIK
ncbi:MAG: DUF6883 domain-containing protein [Aestuariivirga sp.]